MSVKTWKKTLFAMIALFFSVSGICKDPGPISYVIGCNVINESLTLIKSVPGKFCVFLPDGSYVAVGEPDILARLDAKGAVLWKRKIAVHHQIKLTDDGKNILTLTSEIKDGELCRVRYDNFAIIDLKSGKTRRQWSSYEHRKELLNWVPALRLYREKSGLKAALDFDCEYTHFNSIYEIPENPTASKIPAFKKGNYFVSLNGLGLFGILDREFKNIIWTYKNISSPWSFHDAQVLPTGEILVYNNRTDSGDWLSDGKTGSLSLLIFDPVTGAEKWQYPPTGSKTEISNTLSGGVQLLEDGVLFNVNSEEEGGVAFKVALDGKVKWSMKNPFKFPDGKPRPFQDIKQVDLADFLKNNHL